MIHKNIIKVKKYIEKNNLSKIIFSKRNIIMKELRLMKGNEAIAEAAIRAGVDGYFGYPITPQSEVLEYLMAEKPEERTGMVVLQAESEVAAINMVYGGAGAGKMVMTSSSRPLTGRRCSPTRSSTSTKTPVSCAPGSRWTCPAMSIRISICTTAIRKPLTRRTRPVSGARVTSAYTTSTSRRPGRPAS